MKYIDNGMYTEKVGDWRIRVFQHSRSCLKFRGPNGEMAEIEPNGVLYDHPLDDDGVDSAPAIRGIPVDVLVRGIALWKALQ